LRFRGGRCYTVAGPTNGSLDLRNKEPTMGKGDSRHSTKMKKRERWRKKKEREKRRQQKSPAAPQTRAKTTTSQ
jgi:hypothetical protein